MKSVGMKRYMKGLCAKCGNPLEVENITIWCGSCSKKEQHSHIDKLSQNQ